jgi:hypothetical protein
VASAIIVGGITATTFTLSQGLPADICYLSSDIFDNVVFLAVCIAFVFLSGILDLTNHKFYIYGLISSAVGRNAQHFLTSIVFAGVTAGVIALVKANGKQFCSRPRLCSLF